jgi:multiple sugar transport system ATP-binding protein
MKVVLKNLTKTFQGRGKGAGMVTAVGNLDFEIPDGRLVGLLGPSGCGKSTTLNLISGLMEPTEGAIFFGDEDVTELSTEDRNIGLVFQNYALYPHFTVRQNIVFPLENLKGKDKLTRQQMNEMADEVAHLVQLDGLMDRRPRELSGGQQQRVAIARALVKKPRVLLLDEPLSNLDARLRLQTREEIRRIQKETGITTIFVTHDQEEAMSISDLIMVMKDGVLLQAGKPQDVYDDPDSLFVARFLGNPPINLFDGRVRNGRLLLGGADVLDVQGLPDGEVCVGIRPEGFVLDDAGALVCDFERVEVMGRDVSILARHTAFQGGLIRCIMGSERVRGLDGTDRVRFSLKPDKVLVFDKETGKRLVWKKELINTTNQD